MTLSEANELITKINSIFANCKFDTIKKQAYTEFFIKKDYSTVKLAIDKLLIENNFCPSIKEIHEMYQSIKASEKRYLSPFKKSNIACEICKGKGYLVISSSGYQYQCHCQCPASKQYLYDGSTISENLSDFYIPSTTKFYSLEQLLTLASSL